MGLEVVQFVSDLNVAWPTAEDKVREGDDHIRNIKVALANTFPNISGQVQLSHTQLNAIPEYQAAFEAHLFPTGGIFAWSGAADEIPAGHVLCDGANGTPDLRNRFIIGAGGDYEVGDTGGAEEVESESVAVEVTIAGHALTAAEIAAHQHFVATTSQYSGSGDQLLSNSNYLYRSTDGGPGGDTQYILRGTASGPATAGLSSETGGGAEHSHEASSTPHTHTVSTLSPYYALCWIMKTLTWDL